MATTLVWLSVAYLAFGLGLLSGLWFAWEMEHAESITQDNHCDEDLYK